MVMIVIKVVLAQTNSIFAVFTLATFLVVMRIWTSMIDYQVSMLSHQIFLAEVSSYNAGDN